jgi:hypothetical protein
MDVDRFALKALDDVARGRKLITHPAWWRLVSWLGGAAPWIVDALARREYARIRTLLGR